MNAPTYADKLKTARWQRKRLDIFNRDGWLCVRKDCPRTSDILHVHHKDYLLGVEPWDHPDSMMETLCGACHDKEHPKPAPPKPAPPLECVRCKAKLQVEDVAGRDGKNESICEVCAMEAEREHFDERS